ncbi:MAG: diadenylate cyclase [Desulfobacterales bacterium]|nr:MAG: diadenylate cyclase [Desulfobacterales bacterium]
MPLLNFIPTPTWRDLVDILFLTLVAYQLYEWFRETRALRVLIGLVALGGIYSVAKLWGLFLTTWVFQILWQVLLILLLILFQSEIRQVLEKVSPLRYLRSRRRVLRGSIAKDLTRVLFELAAEKTGALVVLTRDDIPSDIIHAGQKIMALPDPVLIKSIFNHHAPAHDGAVIISQQIVTHMGCILPLSEKEDLPERYGTRHRAALGLSEMTDAVCLVVSEERSEVASVEGGKITVWPQPEPLQEKLREWLGGPEIQVPTIQRFFEDFFTKNWKRKLAAFALVAAAWLFLASQQEVEISFRAPVHFDNAPVDMPAGRGLATAVELRLSGRQSEIKGLDSKEVRVHVDLKGLAAGKHKIMLSGKNVDLPAGVKVKQIIPQNIEVEINRPDGKPESGNQIYAPTLEFE